MIKKIFSISLLLFFANNASSQLKIDNVGHVGIGTLWPNPGYSCHIKGNLLLSNYPTVPTYEMQFKVGNGLPGTEIGSSAGKLAFWDSYFGYYPIYAKDFLKTSDSTLKTSIEPIPNALENLLKIKAVTYYIKDYKLENDNLSETKVRNYGFLSQDIERLFPNIKIVEEQKGLKLMDYDQIIPLTVKSIQEQQNQISILKNEIEILKKEVEILKNNSTIAIINNNILYQNTPNPFKSSTKIEFSLNKDNFQSASIMIFDLNGNFLKKYLIQDYKENELLIQENEFKPGIFVYTLIVNNVIIDSKKMIITND